jgi:glycosyltransferase involved in cell wall biosynthesis
VLDQQNVESDVARQTARLAPTILGRLRARLDVLKWRSYEPRLLRTVQATVAVSEEDATAFRKDAPGAHVLVHPNGVDPRAFEFVDHRLNRADHLLMTGTLGYLPNLDAAMWMIRDILPRVCRVRPSIRLTLVGAEPPPSLQAMKGDSVDIIGRVADMRPYLRAADLFVAPLRAGGGTRLKLLEAFAVGLPTVATTKAATGIDLRPGDHAAIADDAEALSGEILRLLDDRDARQAMAASARQLIEDRYDWRLIAVSYERDLLDVVKRVSRTDG